MNPYYPFLNYVFNYGECTKFYLEHFNQGKFRDQVDECVKRNFIAVIGKNEKGDDLYAITELGKRIVDNPREEIV